MRVPADILNSASNGLFCEFRLFSIKQKNRGSTLYGGADWPVAAITYHSSRC